ncbi:hypothetical protein NQ314_008411 [Rhamnusium bicolor]|uniref:Integrase catalytic domain-containing protein n=1 Tax=Rhamnusium bicolor TaxID=1586634 RepID=A0AAV8YAY2_9CUCU|nr:hypothetical protein NQ314_008411 [Rhamnusium bicolor]
MLRVEQNDSGHIFTLFGAPCILHSDNRSEFVNGVIHELIELWLELKLVHRKLCHSQSQGAVERANQDIENILATWLKDNNTPKWTEGVRFLQFIKSRSLYSGITMSSYKVMLGIESRARLRTSTLSDEVILGLNTEEEAISSTTFGNAQSQHTDEREIEADNQESEKLDTEMENEKFILKNNKEVEGRR